MISIVSFILALIADCTYQKMTNRSWSADPNMNVLNRILARIADYTRQKSRSAGPRGMNVLNMVPTLGAMDKVIFMQADTFKDERVSTSSTSVFAFGGVERESWKATRQTRQARRHL